MTKTAIALLVSAFAMTGCYRTMLISETAEQSTANSTSTPQDSTTSAAPGQYTPGVAIVTYSSPEAKTNILGVAKSLGATVIYDYKNFNSVALRKPDGMTLDAMMDELRKIDGVLGVVEDQMCELDQEGPSIALP